LVVVAVLIIAWTWWGVVTWRDRRHSTGRRVNSIASFNNHLSVLERSSPATRGTAARNGSTPSVVGPYRPTSSGAPASDRLRGMVAGSPLGASRSPVGTPAARTLTLSQAQQRRRQMVFGLGGAALVMATLAIVAGGVFVQLAVLVTIAAVAYAVLLVRARGVEIERSLKVRNIATARAGTAALAAVAEPVNRGFGQAYGQGYGQGYGRDYGRTSHQAYRSLPDYDAFGEDEPAYAGYAN